MVRKISVGTIDLNALKIRRKWNIKPGTKVEKDRRKLARTTEKIKLKKELEHG